MSKAIMVIRLPSSLRNSTEWITIAGEGPGEAHTLAVGASLDQLTALPGTNNVHLLLSPEELAILTLTLPAVKFRLTQQTMQWLAEEILTEQAASYHWSVVQQSGKTAHVIGIDAKKLHHYLSQCRAAGLNVTRVLPDGCYLPVHPQGWSLISQEGGWLARTEEHAFNELDEGWLNHLFQHFPPDGVHCYGDLPTSMSMLPALTQSGQISPLALYTPDEQTQRYNMLHGVFQPKTATLFSGKWLPRLAIASVILAAASFVLCRGYALWYLHKTKVVLEQQTQTVWQRYFPHIRRTDNLRFFFARQLTQQFPAAVPLLRHLEAAVQAHPGIHLLKVSYSQPQKSLTLILTADTEEDVDAFLRNMSPFLPLEKVGQNDATWTLRSQ